MPVSGSSINLVPSGAFFIRSRISRETRASVLGGRAVSLKLLEDDAATAADVEYVDIFI